MQPVVQHPAEAGAAGSNKMPGTHLLQLHLLHCYVLLSHDMCLLPAAIFLLPVLLLKSRKKSACFPDKIWEV